MRFANVRLNGAERPGVVADQEIALFPKTVEDFVAFISADAATREQTIRGALKSGPRVPLAQADLAAPIRRFRRDVLCTGWNYWDHFEEGFGKREGQDLANDISQRDLQRRHGGQWLKGKSIDGTMPLGPYIVTADELDVRKIRLRCEVNGQTLQDAVIAQMAFPIEELIAELSFGMTLHPGDVILTGTPSGVGNAREPQLFLKDGDEVVVRGEGLGELRNVLTARDLAGTSDVNLG